MEMRTDVIEELSSWKLNWNEN